MPSRNCDRCGSRIPPYWPRKRDGDDLVCSTCAERASHVQRTAAGFSGEDVVRHQVGRQVVHTMPSGEEICREHLRIRQQLQDAGTGFAAQLGLDHRYTREQHSAPHEGRCAECSKAYAGEDHPWLPRRQPGRPGQISDELPKTTRPWRPKVDRWVKPDTGIQSLNRRVAVALRPGLSDKIVTKARLRFQAHDSGDGETIFHCPFCGSGQVIARSDGTVECEFCTTAFTVQVQPTMPAFPQTIDGVPVDVPGMPAGGANANVPPGAAPGAGMPPGGDPGAEDDGSGIPSGGDDSVPDDEGDGSDKPAFLKGSTLLTASGDRLTRPQYIRHLALTTARDQAAVLDQIRRQNGVA